MNYYTGCWKKYADFSGRARRREYWMFVLFNSIAIFASGFVDGLLGLSGILPGLYNLAALLPGVAVCARRLHDTDRSGWWMLIALVPFIGWIWLLILLVIDSQPGANRFGDYPKAG